MYRMKENMFVNDLEIPNSVTQAALAEYDEMINHPENYKVYDTFGDFLNEVWTDVESSAVKAV